MKRLIISLLLSVAISTFSRAQCGDNHPLHDIFVSCEGDLNFYLRTGVIIYVSDEAGQPSCNDNYFTVINSTGIEICYIAKVLEKYQKALDPNRFIIATTSNISTYYPIASGSRKTIQLIDYRKKADANLKVYLSLTLSIPDKSIKEADMSAWNKIFDTQPLTPATPADTFHAGNNAYPGAIYQGDGKIFYNGINSNYIVQLLGKVKQWKTPSSLSVNDGIPPSVPQQCMRDKYIAAAVNYAWAAESYFRLKEYNKSKGMAIKVLEEITNALELCSDLSTLGTTGNGTCATESIVPCADKNNMISTSGNSTNREATPAITAVTRLVYDPVKSPNAPRKIINYFPYQMLRPGGIEKPTSGFENSILGSIELVNAFKSDLSVPNNPAGPQLSLQVLDNLGDAATVNFFRKGMEDIIKRNEDAKLKYGYSITEFSDAIRKDSSALIERALNSGFPVGEIMDEWEFPDYNGYCHLKPIHLAAMYGSTKCLSLLIEKGADIDQKTRAKNNLLAKSPPTNFTTYTTALHIAIFYNQINAVKILLDKGASRKFRSGLYKEKINFKVLYSAKEIAEYFKYQTLIDLLSK